MASGAPSIDTLLGALLLSTWLNSMLFGFQIIQGYTYFTTYRKEVYMNIVVAALYAIDVAGMVGQYSNVYLSAITNFGDLDYLGRPAAAPRGIYLIAIQLSGAIVQCYLTLRVYRLSKNIYIALVLWAGAMLALGGGLGLTIINVTYTALADRGRQTVVVSIWLITAAVVDVLIAVILVFYLWRAKRKSAFVQTHNVLKRLMTSSLETGSLTALLAVIVEVLFSTLKKTNLQVAFVYLLGRAYSLTMMYNLNSRAELRQSNRTGTSDSAAMSMPSRNATVARTPMSRGFGETTSYPIEIQVAQSAVSHLDNDSHKGAVYGEDTAKSGFV